MLTVNDIITALERSVPPHLAAPWDHVGLQVGSRHARVKKVYVSLDPTLDVINRAIAAKCELLVTHHPLYLKPPAHFDFASGVGEMIATALRHRLSIYAAHTNLDAAEGGLNDLLCDKLGLNHRHPLQVARPEHTHYKLVVFVPTTHTQSVLSALFTAGAGRIGEYDYCSFRTPGTGTFRPLAGADPFSGTKGALNEASEDRVEVLVPSSLQRPVEAALLSSHPYEEIAFDWIPLATRMTDTAGIGRVGTLNAPISAADFVDTLKSIFKVPTFRWIGSLKGKIRTVAVCSGSGASLIPEAIRANADLFITGDMKYHDALDATAAGLRVADIGHFPTEHWAVDLLSKMMQKGISQMTGNRFTKADLSVIKDRSQRDPFVYL